MYPNKPADKGGRLSGISIFELFIKFRKDLRGVSLSLTNFMLFLSGKAVSEIVNFYKIKLDNTFVIHDDLDLELSKVKIKQGGGNGGHNGLESIDQFIGENYFRIRIGIDHPGHKDLVSSYVLNKFLKSEEEIINKKIDKMVNNIELIFSDIPLFLTKISEQS